MTVGTGKAGRWQARGIILTAIAVMVAAVWFVSQAQREASREGADDAEDAQMLLTNRLDMETGLRGFLLTGKEAFLDPYRSGLSGFRSTMADARGTGRNLDLLDRQQALTAEWVGLTKTGIAESRRGDPSNPADLFARKKLMDEFRVVNDRYAQVVQDFSDARQSEARTIAIVLTGVLGLLGLLIGYMTIERPAGRRARQPGRARRVLGDAPVRRDRARGPVARPPAARARDSGQPRGGADDQQQREPAAAGDGAHRGFGQFAKALRTASPSSCLAVRRGQRYAAWTGSRRP